MSIVNRYIIIITLHALIHKADAQSLFSDSTIMAMVRQGATQVTLSYVIFELQRKRRAAGEIDARL